jgi:hypothetical protein
MRVVIQGCKESGWFADNPTNPHVAGATGGNGNYGSDGSASAAQKNYASTLITNARDGYLYQPAKDELDRTNKREAAVASLGRDYNPSSTKPEWNKAFADDLITGSHEWLSSIDANRMSASGISKLIDRLKGGGAVTAWIGTSAAAAPHDSWASRASAANKFSTDSVAEFLNAHIEHKVVAVVRGSGVPRIMPKDKADWST